MSTTIPSPSYTLTPDTDRGLYSDKRTYTYRWVSAVEQSPHGLNAVELSIGHDKDRKRIDVDIRVCRVEGQRSVQYVIGPRETAPATVKRVPVARYSRKTLDATAADALAAFPANIPAGSLAEAIWATVASAQPQSA